MNRKTRTLRILSSGFLDYYIQEKSMERQVAQNLLMVFFQAMLLDAIDSPSIHYLCALPVI
jgi:hypothetical protein